VNCHASHMHQMSRFRPKLPLPAVSWLRRLHEVNDSIREISFHLSVSNVNINDGVTWAPGLMLLAGIWETSYLAAKKLKRFDVVLFSDFGKFRDVISTLDTTRSIHFLPKSILTPTVILNFDVTFSELIQVSSNKPISK